MTPLVLNNYYFNSITSNQSNQITNQDRTHLTLLILRKAKLTFIKENCSFVNLKTEDKKLDYVVQMISSYPTIEIAHLNQRNVLLRQRKQGMKLT